MSIGQYAEGDIAGHQATTGGTIQLSATGENSQLSTQVPQQHLLGFSKTSKRIVRQHLKITVVDILAVQVIHQNIITDLSFSKV